jgi:hypothetical protein
MKSLCLLFWAAALFSSPNEKNVTRNPDNGNSSQSKFATGMYYEYSISVRSSRLKNGDLGTSTMKIYLSGDGHARIERDMPTRQGAENKFSHMVIIGYSGKPTESTILYEKNKTYSVIHFDSLKMPAAMKIESTVSKAGEEKILGYGCVHARIISAKQYGTTMTIIDTVDIWKSPDVPVPAMYDDWLKTFENKSAGFSYAREVPAKLTQIGCKGFTVKLLTRTTTVSVTMELVKAEHENFSGSLFEIPAGYAESKDKQSPF